MEMNIIITFCVIDDYLKAINYKDDVQAKMTTAEIMTAAIIAAMFFGGNHASSCRFLRDHRYVKFMLSKSQFNRRIHSIDVHIWEMLQQILGQVFQERNTDQKYVVDSFPVPVCHNIRIGRCKIYRNEKHRGYCASKREYFFGIRVHMITTIQGEPVEVIFAPGSASDTKVFKDFELDFPDNALLIGDAAYNDYEQEDLIHEATNTRLLVDRKTNSKRQNNLYIDFLIKKYRKVIETTFSSITRLFPKRIHAVISRGFELKIFTFILAYAMSLM